MRSTTVALQNILASQQFVRCRLYTFTPISGVTYHWTDADTDVVYNAVTYSSQGVSFNGFQYKISRGLSIDEFDIDVLSKESDTLSGVNWNIAAISGALDGAVLRVHYAFLADWDSDAEALEDIFNGYVSEVLVKEIAVTLHVVSFADKLNTQVPRLLFQPTCTRTLGDSGCTVNLSSYTTSDTVNASPNRYTLTSGLTAVDGYYSLGKILFTSGDNAGVRRSIKSYTQSNGTIELSYPLDYDLANGDTFTITAGCDKTRGGNGCAKFSNVINFKGFPYIPNPESVQS